MTFEAYEESQSGASRVELYTLTVGSTIYRMHDSVELVLNIALLALVLNEGMHTVETTPAGRRHQQRRPGEFVA